VREVLPDGGPQTFPTGTTIDSVPPHPFGWSVTLAAGQKVEGHSHYTEKPNFGNGPTTTGTISGYKWNDLNSDGAWDTDEPGLANWTIYLDTNGDGTPGSDEPARVTNADGYYVFDNLPAGSYMVREVLLEGWTQTFPPQQPPNSVSPKPYGWTVTLAAGQMDVAGRSHEAENLNFGNGHCSISGYKWNDLNDDGVWDASEPGLANWTIYLDTDRDGKPGLNEPARVTDANGRYLFDNLSAGSYTIREVLPENWIQSFPAEKTADSVPPYPYGWTVTLTAGQKVAGRSHEAEKPNFGNWKQESVTKALSSLSGFVYADSDDDGVRDVDDDGVPVEIGLPNAEIGLYLLSGNAGYSLVDSTTTDPDGWYDFEDLEPGTYRLVEQQPSAFLDRKDTLGRLEAISKTAAPTEADRGKASDDQFSGIVLRDGIFGLDYNFGEVLSAKSINKRMFLASPPPVKETIASRMGITAKAVQGTTGDDTISVAAQDRDVVVTVNGPSKTYSTSAVKLVTIDAKGGNDTVAISGSRAADVVRQSPSQATLRSSNRYSSFDYAVEVVAAEKVRTPRTTGTPKGRLVVLQDSPAADHAEVGGDTATVSYGSTARSAEAAAYEQVRAISTSGQDTLERRGATDFLLQSLGNWQES
jgi:hypothetical protein